MILTVGHSTRTLDEFLALLHAHRVQVLVDVRMYAWSERHPHFQGPPLAAALARADVAYHHLPELGGRRKPTGNPRNAGLRNASFRAFADYMQTPAFDLALDRLLGLWGANNGQVAIMCSEAAPWRCHRGLITDALLARGASVAHVLSCGPARPAALSPAARVEGSRVCYPSAAGVQEALL